MPTALAKIVGDYANDIGRNGTNWYTALSKLNLLPQSIPPLPSNIHEILMANCPIYSDKRVNDTHSLFLFPAGTIDTLAERFFGVPINPLTDCLASAKRHTLSDEFTKCEWGLVTNDLLPDSREKTHEEQKKMIQEIRDRAFLPYEVPPFKYALAANLLNTAAEGDRSLWLNRNDIEGRTRVQETFRYAPYLFGSEVREETFSFGNSRCNSTSGVQQATSIEDCRSRSLFLGVAALYRFPDPRPRFCVLV